MENCKVCGQPMKLIPAGISKTTGKSYSAFYACSDRTHKQPKTFQAQAQPTYVPAPVEQPDWDKIGEKKSDDIRANVALKMTSEIIAAGIIPLQDWRKWTDEFYDYKPGSANPFA